MECFKDSATANLFLEINPNIDEIAKEQEELKVDSDLQHKQSVIKRDKYSHEDVFNEVTPSSIKKPKSKPNPKKQIPIPMPAQINEVVSSIPEELEETACVKPEPLPMLYRDRKKLERQKLKQEEKDRKKIEKDKHREIMKEKNRTKARERYYRLREEKTQVKEESAKQIPQKIVEETKSKLNSFQRRDLNTKINKSNDIDFATFTNYMLKYEDLKHKFNQQRKQEDDLKKKETCKPQQRESPFPVNYPIHLLYGNKKKRNNMF